MEDVLLTTKGVQMGTRGAIVFVSGGVEKTVYNHWDSYPSSLGVKMVEWLRHAGQDLPTLRRRVDALRMVSPDMDPTAEDRERLSRYADPDVNRGEGWYSLLRHTQGDPEAILEAGVAEDVASFPLDSLFCEWTYVVDLDNENFEVYKGFQDAGPTKGRWSTVSAPNEDGYWPVSQITSWSIAEELSSNISAAGVMDAVERILDAAQ